LKDNHLKLNKNETLMKGENLKGSPFNIKLNKKTK